MKKLFIVLICVGMVAGIGIGGFMMLQTLGQEQGQEQTRQEQKQPKYSTRESVFADANPSLSEAEVKKRVAMNLDQEPYTSAAEVKDPDSITVLVNQYNTLPSDYMPEDLDVVVQDEQGVIALRKEAADAYRALEAEAKENQVDLRIMTAFIPYDSIQASYEELKKAHGEAAVDASFSRPGSSEYQTGLSGHPDRRGGKRPAEYRAKRAIRLAFGPAAGTWLYRALSGGQSGLHADERPAMAHSLCGKGRGASHDKRRTLSGRIRVAINEIELQNGFL